MLKKYRCLFYGRKVGAIGVEGFHCRDVMADSPQAARLALYATHEHISGLRVIDNDTQEVTQP